MRILRRPAPDAGAYRLRLGRRGYSKTVITGQGRKPWRVSLRHTFATRCIEAEMKPKTLQYILGHSRIEMTMNLYVHVTDETVIKEMEKFELAI